MAICVVFIKTGAGQRSDASVRQKQTRKNGIFPETHIEQIKENFDELYLQMNGMTLREMDKIICPVCTLCRDHEKAGFIEGIKIGIPLSQELKNPCATKLRTCMVYSFRGYRFPQFREGCPKLPDSSATAGNT